MASELKPCGGCGATSDRERCIGCLHDFGTTESAWVRTDLSPGAVAIGKVLHGDEGELDDLTQSQIRTLNIAATLAAEAELATRPAPAATDTGLETVELRQEIFKLAKDLFWRADGNQRLWSSEEREVYGLQAAMQIARSQAEELLAAERAEKEKLEAAWLEAEGIISDLKAHNAAKDAEREAIMQAITDPENQPSKFGTVTIAFFNEKIAAKNARAKTLEQVNAKLCDDVIDYELKIAERDVALSELKQKLADKFSFTSDDDALAVLERYGHKETGNGIIKADMRSLDDMCRAAVAYLCAEWDFVFQDTVELNREALEADNAALTARVKELDHENNCWMKSAIKQQERAKSLEAQLAAARKALEPFADHAKERAVDAPEWRDTDTVQIVVTIGDLRKARAVLGGKP